MKWTKHVSVKHVLHCKGHGCAYVIEYAGKNGGYEVFRLVIGKLREPVGFRKTLKLAKNLAMFDFEEWLAKGTT